MQSGIVKRSIVIAGHKTSVSLEDEFWNGLKEISRDQSMTLSAIVAGLDSHRRSGNLSSAIRLYVLDHYRAQMVALTAHQVGFNATPPSIMPTAVQSL